VSRGWELRQRLHEESQYSRTRQLLDRGSWPHVLRLQLRIRPDVHVHVPIGLRASSPVSPRPAVRSGVFGLPIGMSHASIRVLASAAAGALGLALAAAGVPAWTLAVAVGGIAGISVGGCSP
jgi:hypothetical protein